jgi:hypothetical protein
MDSNVVAAIAATPLEEYAQLIVFNVPRPREECVILLVHHHTYE